MTTLTQLGTQMGSMLVMGGSYTQAVDPLLNSNTYTSSAAALSNLTAQQTCTQAMAQQSADRTSAHNGDVIIREVANGYMVITRGAAWDSPTTYVAADAEELLKVITLAMVNRKIDAVR